MALTLLQVVNKTLKRVRVIQGDSGELTSLTDTARQTDIDIAVDIWNEVANELYIAGDLGNTVAEGSITLVTDTREYSLPSDFQQMAGETHTTRVLVNAENAHRLFEYPTTDGAMNPYAAMFADQPDPDDFEGQPSFWAISPKADNIRVDSDPSSDENGDVYKFLYEVRQNVALAADTFPVGDTVLESLVPVVADIFRIDRSGQSHDPISSNAGFIRAVSVANKSKVNRTYGPRYRKPGR